jgi:hypothetical protein
MIDSLWYTHIIQQKQSQKVSAAERLLGVTLSAGLA